MSCLGRHPTSCASCIPVYLVRTRKHPIQYGAHDLSTNAHYSRYMQLWVLVVLCYPVSCIVVYVDGSACCVRQTAAGVAGCSLPTDVASCSAYLDCSMFCFPFRPSHVRVSAQFLVDCPCVYLLVAVVEVWNFYFASIPPLSQRGSRCCYEPF